QQHFQRVIWHGPGELRHGATHGAAPRFFRCRIRSDMRFVVRFDSQTESADQRKSTEECSNRIGAQRCGLLPEFRDLANSRLKVAWCGINLSKGALDRLAGGV